MALQDVRIVELIKLEKPMAVSQESHVAKDYLAITHYNKIRVHPVTVAQGEHPMQAAYRVMEKIPSHCGKQDYEFRQLIVGFADVEGREQEVQRFWEDRNCPLFFVTMVNVSLNVDLKDEVDRIRKVLDGVDYQLYLTYEYDEILIFAKSPSLHTYAECVMKIGFHNENRGVLDTITVCCFGDNPEVHEDENTIVCIQLGVKDYQKAIGYLNRKGIDMKDIHWILGRGDIGFLMVKSSLSWVHELYQDCRTPGREEEFQWLSTTQFSVMIRHERTERLTGELTGKSVKSPWSAISEQQLEQIYPLYEAKCKELHIQIDPVFERILCQTGRLVDNALENQLSQDLAVCILPELDDFLRYLEYILTSSELQEKHAEVLRSSLNSFYLNVLSLVNSTVHSNQEFVLIPHSAPPSFEMPPKVIAYYGLIVRQIIEAFKDDKRIYGVMLAPKLVDDLEVESFSITELEKLGHLLSVSVGEQFLYNPQDTVLTLGHEMAHFVGEDTRERGHRRKMIFSFYLYRLLSRLCNFCLGLLPSQAELGQLVDSETLYQTAEKLSEHMVEYSLSERPLTRELPNEIKMLAGIILHNPIYVKDILQNVILPMFKVQECQKYLAWHLNAVLDSPDDERADAYLYARAKRIFEQAVRDCLENWSASIDEKEFSDYIGYLFTESYADLAMVILFEMSMDEYIHIFSRGMEKLGNPPNTTEDTIEMTRFIAVIRAAARTQEDWGDTAVGAESLKWENGLQGVAEAACNWDILDYCKKSRIDIILVTCLVKYLVKCGKSLKEHFKGESQRAAIEELHVLHKDIKEPSTFLSRITRIRKQEQECLNRLILPRQKQGS